MQMNISTEEDDRSAAEEVEAIYVKIIRTVKVGLNELETVDDLKSALTDVVGMAEHDQHLLFAGNRLENCHDLAHYKIPNGSTLYMLPHSDQILVYITFPWIKDAIPIYVKESDTLTDVKELIQEEGYPMDGLSLSYNGERLIDWKPLAVYDIHSLSVLDAIDDSDVFAKVFVSVPDTKDIEMKVKGWYTVSKIKTMIEDIVGTPINRQRLYFGMKQLEDVQLLADYNIQNMSKLNLANLPGGIVIHVRVLNGKTFMLEVKVSNTVYDVKKKIRNITDISISNMSVLFAGQKLEDELYLADYSVKDESVLILVCRNREW